MHKFLKRLGKKIRVARSSTTAVFDMFPISYLPRAFAIPLKGKLAKFPMEGQVVYDGLQWGRRPVRADAVNI